VTALLKKADPPSIRSALDGEVDDVIATVRNLLDAGEQRALSLQGSGMPKANPPQDRTPLPQRPPAPMPPVAQAKGMEQPKAAARSNQLVPSPAGGKADMRGNRKDRKEPEAGKQARRMREGAGSIAHLFDGIPRAMTAGVAETVEIQLSKDEAMALLAGGKPHELSKSAPTRAITIKLAAPEGGFLIETLSPETQWLFDRPAFLGEEAFGRWVYVILPQERGKHVLTLEVHIRDIDLTGVARDTPIPAQAVEIRVRRGYRRAFASIFRSLFLFAAGGAITEGGLYLLKILGKIPQMPWQ
jgi:hypothetical protein